MTPQLSVVIVSYNSRLHLQKCLESLASNPPAVLFETVVVDNASVDGTVTMLREQWPSVKVVDAGTNLGFAAANNRGFGATTGELVLLLNPDARVRPRTLDVLLAALASRPDAAVVGPRLVDSAGRPELSFGSMISPLAELRQKCLVRGNHRRLPLVSGYVDRLTHRAQEVDWVSGACLLVRRTDAEAVGLMDERYFMYIEDVDFCAAIRQRGRRVLFVPAAEVEHLRGESARTAPDATHRAYRASQIAFYDKHHPSWAPLLRLYLKLKGEA
jgi:hypothetical protein